MNGNSIDGTRTMVERHVEIGFFSRFVLTLSDPDKTFLKFVDMMLWLKLKTRSALMSIGFMRTDNFIKHLF